MSVVAEELLRIYQRDGKLHPEQVVDEAMDPSSPLHTCFTWDDSDAAHRWRVREAEELIRRPEVRVVIEERVHKVRAFVHIEGTPGYVSTADALNDADLSARLFDQFRRDIENLVSRYERFQAAAPVVASMQKWLAQQPPRKKGGFRRR